MDHSPSVHNSLKIHRCHTISEKEEEHSENLTNRLLESDKKSEGENIPVVYITETKNSQYENSSKRIETDRFRKSIDQIKVLGDITNVVNNH